MSLETYRGHRPTQFDGHLALDGREDWLIVPCSRTRDSGPSAESNFASALELLGGEGDDVEVHRFGHWGPGWYEIILVRSGTAAEATAKEIAKRLVYSPFLDKDDHSKREDEAAQETWSSCYSDAQRIEYIRDHRSQFEFHSFADMLSCARGKYFAGDAFELVEDNGY